MRCCPTVTEERKKKFDFSSYHDLWASTRAATGPSRNRKARRCAGLKVVVGASTNQDQILRQWDQQNIAAGLKPVEYQYFDAVVGRLAVITGRADVSFEPIATGAYSARDGKVRRVGLFPGGWPNAAAISVTTRKGSAPGRRGDAGAEHPDRQRHLRAGAGTLECGRGSRATVADQPAGIANA